MTLIAHRELIMERVSSEFLVKKNYCNKWHPSSRFVGLYNNFCYFFHLGQFSSRMGFNQIVAIFVNIYLLNEEDRHGMVLD